MEAVVIVGWAQVVSWTLQHLATASRDAQDSMRAAGALPLLARLLDGPFDSGTTEKSVWALCNLAADNPANREAIRCAYCIHLGWDASLVGRG
jgi:hypothetical protein